MTTLFQQFLMNFSYGPDLFRKQFNKDPKYYFDKPLIYNDKLIIKEKTIKYLSKKFNGKLILISGRSKIAANFTLNKHFGLFYKRCMYFFRR